MRKVYACSTCGEIYLKKFHAYQGFCQSGNGQRYDAKGNLLIRVDTPANYPPKCKIKDVYVLGRQELLGILKHHVTPSERVKLLRMLKDPQSGDKGKCKCGKPGVFIADGICRTGFYCKKCDKEAIDNG